ncbi:MAG: acyl-CoA dehydrogenase family protein [Deltaproteobacteria bacterium]
MRDPSDEALDGHVSPADPLSPRAAFARIAAAVRPIVRYDVGDPWEVDTARLPGPLARYRRQMRAFAERHLGPRALAADLEPHAATGTMSEGNRALLGVAAREGLLSDLLPWPLGSLDPRLLRYPLFLPQALKAEELARADGGLMLLVCANGLGVGPVVLSGDLGLVRRELLPAFRANARGEPWTFAFAITEPGGGSDVEDGHGARTYKPGVTARREAGGHRLRGRKCYISGGDVAKRVVVFAALEGEGMTSWTAFLVANDAPGFRVARTELKMGMRASAAAEIELDDVFVPDAGVVGGLRGGWALNRATLNMSRIPVAAMGVGFARAATEEATRFACTFRLAGKPLVAYQEVQLALADMMAETQAARAMTWDAAQHAQARQGLASAAKFHATDTARRVCERAMDLLGNHSVLHGQRVEKALRDVRLTQIFEGTNQINRLAVIEEEQERLLAAIRTGRDAPDDRSHVP